MNNLANKRALLGWAREFKEAAIADGWKAEALYEGNEPIDSACRLLKEGFVMQVITRDWPKGEKNLVPIIEGSIAIWGPDTLAVDVPTKYSWDEIKKGIRKCSWCNGEDKDTFRVAFANRVCKECLPAARAKLEFRGWCD